MNYQKLIRIGYWAATAIIVIVGLTFSILIAHFEDAPGAALIGGALTLAGAAAVFGIGEIINLLFDIKKSMNPKQPKTNDKI